QARGQRARRIAQLVQESRADRLVEDDIAQRALIERAEERIRRAGRIAHPDIHERRHLEVAGKAVWSAGDTERWVARGAQVLPGMRKRGKTVKSGPGLLAAA